MYAPTVCSMAGETNILAGNNVLLSCVCQSSFKELSSGKCEGVMGGKTAHKGARQ